MSENNAPRRSTKGKIALIALAVVVVIALAAYWLTADYRAYSRAVALQDAGDHSGALAILETIPDYQDAPERINVCCYAIALEQEAAGSYAEAQAAFAALGDYKDAPERAAEAGYQLAVALENTGGAQEAADAFAALGNYKDSAARAANLESAIERYTQEAQRVQTQSDALRAALAAGEALLAEGSAPLDEATRTELEACVEAGKAAEVEPPAEPVTLAEVEAAADALTKIDCADLAQRTQSAVDAYADSVARYALVDAPTVEFVADRLLRVEEIARIAVVDASGAPVAAADGTAEEAPAAGDAAEEAAAEDAVEEEVVAEEAADEDIAEEAVTEEAADEDIAEEIVADKAADEEATEEAVADESADEDAAEDAVADEAAGEDIVEEAVTDEATAENAAEEAVTEEAADEEAAEEAIADEAADENAAEEAVAEEAADKEVAEESVTDEAANEEASEEAIADEAVDENAAEESVAEEAANEEASEEAVADKATAEDAAEEIAADETADEEVAEEAVADEAADEEAIVDEVADEDIAEEIVAEEAADEDIAEEAVAEEAGAEETAGETAAEGDAPIARVYFASTLVSEAYTYLPDEELIALGEACGGSVELYESAEAARRRDDELDAQSGAHMAAGTLVIRLSDALSALERQALMAEVLDSLTAAQPGEAVEREEQTRSLDEVLAVAETGFAVADGRLYYALVLVNDMANTTVEFPRVRVTFYDEAGEVVAEDEAVRMAICPGQRLAWASTVWGVEEAPASAQAEIVAPRSRDFVNDAALCAPLEVREARVEESGDGPVLRCELYNPNEFDAPSAAVTILYRDGEGALLSGESAWCEAIPAGGSTAFEMPLTAALVQDNFEVYACIG